MEQLPLEDPPSPAVQLGFERQLWAAANKLISVMDAAEYKHVVLGLIFLKYISDAFTARREVLAHEVANPDSELFEDDPQLRLDIMEDRDEYLAESVFWVPPEARWESLQANARQPGLGRRIDDAMALIEKENPVLKGILPKDYGRLKIDERKLGELVDLIGAIGFKENKDRARDILGRVYEYFLGQFASAEGKKAGQFYTPSVVVRVLVEMLAPYHGRVYDPCCGSGGMFVQSERFVEAHGGRNDLDNQIYATFAGASELLRQAPE